MLNHSEDALPQGRLTATGAPPSWGPETKPAPRPLAVLSPVLTCAPMAASPATWFDALKHRLKDLEEGVRHPACDDAMQAWMRSLAHDCVVSLDRLQELVMHEHARRWQLEMHAFDARADLAKLRAELAGSQAGMMVAHQQAMHDSLTSLPNRHHFHQRLSLALEVAAERHKSLAVFFVDLDGFKGVNDSYGHAAGDELLGIIAARLSRAVRADDVVGRVGGDEFACLLLDVKDRRHLSRLACKVYDTVSAPIRIGDLLVTIHPSIGIAILPGAGSTTEAMLHGADMAMYQAKRELTGYAFFESEDQHGPEGRHP